ncbi:MAG: CamS family sex pheromone protein [Breznakia sp.]
MKSKITWLLCFCVLSGCGLQKDSDEASFTTVTKAVEAGDYQTILPYNSTDSRQTHVDFNRGSYDRIAVGEGLLAYSKKYFSPDDYAIQEGMILDRDTLQVGAYFGDHKGLLGYQTKENTSGLNPEKGSTIPVGNGVEIISGVERGKETIPIVDIFEVDFFDKEDKANEDREIKGISLTIVLNEKIKDDQGKEYIMSKDSLMTYASEKARHLIAYLREQPAVGQDIPIFVTMFNAASTDSALPGCFIGEGYGTDSINDFSEIDEEWTIFPSERAQALDSVIYSQFESIKNALKDFLPNDIGVTGKGKFTDGKLEYLSIHVITQIKTYTESSALLQYMNSLLANIKSEEIEIIVEISSDEETYALIKRAVGSLETVVVSK